ncbi:hypothetical protein D3C80_2021900 [compost metagenome]
MRPYYLETTACVLRGSTSQISTSIANAYRLFQPIITSNNKHNAEPTIAINRERPCKIRQPANIHSR